jgi:uncharacterized protein (TIGR03067 family)
MNRPRSLAVGLALLAGTLGAPAAPGLKDKDDKNDVKVESWVQIGQVIPMDASWSFKGDKYTLDMGSNLEEGTIKIDQVKKPATIDLEITGGNCKGKDQPGIYKFDGDTLILCFAWPGVADRPTDFTSTKDNRWILITLKRAK